MTRACVISHKSPMEANYGLLCAMCYDGLRSALQGAPSSLQHLREIYVMRSPMELDIPKPLKKEPPAPFNLDAWQLAEDMWQALTGGYIPVKWNHFQIYGKAKEICQALHQDIDNLVNRKEVIYLMPLVKTLDQALYRYPLEEKSRATLLPCPSCNLKTVYSPPFEFGDDLQVKCHSCGFVIPPDKMAFYANLAERERD